MKKVLIKELEVGKMYIEGVCGRQNYILVLTKPQLDRASTHLKAWRWLVLYFEGSSMEPQKRYRTDNTVYYSL